MKINSIINFKYSNNSIVCQRKNNSRTKLNFASKHLAEDFFVCKNNDLKADNVIPNLGQIIDIFDVLNIKTNTIEKTLLLCQKNKNAISYKLIKKNPEMINKLFDFLENNSEINNSYQNNSFSFSVQTLEKLKNNYPKTFEIIKDLVISEINAMIIKDKTALDKISTLGYEKLDNSKDIIGIQNFIVYKKEYKNASKYVAIALLKKILNENPNIIIKASAFGENPSSPVNLYLRYGFIPLSENLEEIKKHTIKTNKGNRIDPNYQVVMYLPKDAILYSIIKNTKIN